MDWGIDGSDVFTEFVDNKKNIEYHQSYPLILVNHNGL